MKNMKAIEIEEVLVKAIHDAGHFNAPFGVLTGEYKDAKGRKYRLVTFGRARTLDASILIYGPTFMVFRTSHGRQAGVARSVAEALDKIAQL